MLQQPLGKIRDELLRRINANTRVRTERNTLLVPKSPTARVVSPKVSYSCPLTLQNEVASVFPVRDEISMHFAYHDVSFPDRQRPPKINFLRTPHHQEQEKAILCWPLTVRKRHNGIRKMHGDLFSYGKDSGHLIPQIERTGIYDTLWRNDPQA